MFKIILRAVSVIQMLLGFAYLFAPSMLLKMMGHSSPLPDIFYPLGMLSARFLGYGLGLWIASSEPSRHIVWIRLMALIQFIDLCVGAYYTLSGVVPLTLSGPPMFNALWIGASLGFMRPRKVA